ncbi:MAG: hypothetical protein ACTSP4_00480 [Candidatus Hodarchaeales archaeon]
MTDTRTFPQVPEITTLDQADLLLIWDSSLGKNNRITHANEQHSPATYRDFDTSVTGVTSVEGRVSWDDDSGTLSLGMPGGNVNLQIGQELHLPRKVKNNSGTDIKNGNLIYISGGTGVNIEITLAIANDVPNADRTLAMATEDIDDGSFGFCTAFGLVSGETLQPIDTSIGAAGDRLYLSPTVVGGFTVTRPEAPNRVVCIGNIFRSHASEGSLVVNIKSDKTQMLIDVSREPTGFTHPEDVIITGDSTTRTVTLTGTVNAYYQAYPVVALTSGWTSPAHGTDTSKAYFLIYDGSTTSWVATSTVDEDEFYGYLLIAITYYNPTDAVWIYQRECHGMMPWQTHRELHHTLGTYRESGAVLGDYTLSSTTAADRRPSISSGLIYDEDLPSTITALPVGTYSQFYLSGASPDINIITTGTDIVPLSGSRPYYNEFTGGSWQQTVLPNGDYMNIWLAAVPVAADATSQKFRYVWVQGQNVFGTVVGAAGETINDITFGPLTGLTPEVVFTSKITVRYIGGNWSLISIYDLTGTKSSQSQSAAGNYLSSVYTDATLTGLGTSGDVLGIDLTNANTWTATQTINSLTTGTGATIDEFSTDGTLAGNSDTAGLTEKAVKTYVDVHTANGMFTRTGTDLTPTNSGDSIKMGTGVVKSDIYKDIDSASTMASYDNTNNEWDMSSVVMDASGNGYSGFPLKPVAFPTTPDVAKKPRVVFGNASQEESIAIMPLKGAIGRYELYDGDPVSPGENAVWAVSKLGNNDFSIDYWNGSSYVSRLDIDSTGRLYAPQIITSGTSPTLDDHLTRKDYVDALFQGTQWKSSCIIATTGDITLSGEQTIDGTLTSSDRVLVWQQSDQKENGIYVSSSSSWTRADDANTGVELVDATVPITQGSTYDNKTFKCTNNSINIGVDDIIFTSLASTESHNALSLLQGGITDEYYHFTYAQHSNLTSVTPTFSNLIVTSALAVNGQIKSNTGDVTIKPLGANDAKIELTTGNAYVETTTALTNTPHTVQKLYHLTSGTPVAGIGLAMEFVQETSSGNNEQIGEISAITRSVTPSHETSELVFSAMTDGAVAVSFSTRGFDVSDTDINAFLDSSTSGSLVQGPENLHYVVGIQGNGGEDSFTVIGTESWPTDEDYSNGQIMFQATAEGNIGFGGKSYGDGKQVMFIANATTVPSSNPSGGGILYVESGKLKYRGSSGTITIIADA